MKPNELTPEQSIAIIGDMVAQTRENLERGGGKDFLIWGYTSLFVTAAVYALLIYTHNPFFTWLWLTIPILGYPISTIVHKGEQKSGQATSYIQKSVSRIWLVIGIACIIAPLALTFSSMYAIVLPVEGIMLSIGVILTGLTIAFAAFTVGGVLSFFISLLMLIFPSFEYQVPLFAAMFVVAMIIPGHILNCKRCSKN